jgi:hypothetical protein
VPHGSPFSSCTPLVAHTGPPVVQVRKPTSHGLAGVHAAPSTQLRQASPSPSPSESF